MSLARAAVAASLLAVVPVQAQSTQGADDQPSNWRQANDAVGKFLRGHIDILKSEAKSRTAAAPTNTSDQGAPLTLPQAKRLMLAARPSLFTSGGDSVAERNAHAVSVNEALSALSRAWTQAVGAQRLLKLQEGATEAAEIANELGQRMGTVGNWGADRVLAVGLQASAERLKLSQAQENAVRTKAALAQWVMTDAFVLPEKLPSLRGVGARQDLTTNPAQLAQERLKRLPNYDSDLAMLKALEATAGPGPLKAWETFAQSRVGALLDGQGASALTVDTTEVLWNHDMRFTPADITVKANETLRFVVNNNGVLLHEIVIGTPVELQKHAVMMEKFPNMVHDEPYMAHVDPGKQGVVVWNFNRPGEFEFACLLPGHYQAGMKGKITVKE